MPLVTKPVSRTMIFLGKLFGAFIILLVSYAILYGYITLASLVIYGPQSDLQFMRHYCAWKLVKHFYLGSINVRRRHNKQEHNHQRNRCDNAISSSFHCSPNNQRILRAFCKPQLFSWDKSQRQHTRHQHHHKFRHRQPCINVVNYALYPSATVSYFRMNITAVRVGESSIPTAGLVYTEPTSLVAARSVSVAVAYTAALLAVAWVAFKRSQIME